MSMLPSIRKARGNSWQLSGIGYQVSVISYRLIVKKVQRQILRRCLDGCLRLLLLLTELEHQLPCVSRTFRVQPVITTPTCCLNKRLSRLAVTQQVLLNKLMNLGKVRLVEQRTIHVIHVAGNRLNADAAFACLSEDIQNLLFVGH